MSTARQLLVLAAAEQRQRAVPSLRWLAACGLPSRAATGVWLTIVVAVYTLVGLFGTDLLRTERQEADARHAARMSPDGVEAGRTAPALLPVAPDATPPSR